MRSMRLHVLLCASALLTQTGLLACSPVANTAGSGGGGSDGTTATTTTPTDASGGNGQGGEGGLNLGGAGGSGAAGGGISCTPGGPDDDVDQDGYTPNQGDCEDCDPSRNPNAF